MSEELKLSKKRTLHPYRTVENVERMIRSRLKEWETAGIIPKIYRGKVIEVEQKK